MKNQVAINGEWNRGGSVDFKIFQAEKQPLGCLVKELITSVEDFEVSESIFDNEDLKSLKSLIEDKFNIEVISINID